ncbi:hypothetical protein DMS60_03635 [Klebsiella variicola]|nr:hypothetical protein DMS60_03635 [Klebsiella variicola]
MHLLLHSGFLAAASAKNYLFSLAENIPYFVREEIRIPRNAKVSIKKWYVVRVINDFCISEDL